MAETSALPSPGPLAEPTLAAAGVDYAALGRESLALWTVACDAWCDYVVQLARVAGPAAWMEANLRLAGEAVEIFSLATADRLKEAGVTTPLLCDA